MNIIVLVKQVPDTAQLSKTVDGLKLLEEGSPRIVNPWDEYALETAIQLKEAHGGKVTALCLGKQEATEALKTALAMGADEAILISDLLPIWMRTVALRELPHQFFWDGQEHVDPAKEANAQATRLSNHTTTLAYEYARQGRDWENALRQRAKELSLMRELGLGEAQPQPADPEDDETEQEETDDAPSKTEE